MNSSEIVIVSACLAGIKCRYNATSRSNKKIIKLIKNGKAVPLCPEQLAGLSTPRLPAEIKNRKITDINGHDLTNQYISGAHESLKITKLLGCSRAYLKSKSPMCGCNLIYDGTFSNTLTKGDGIFTKMLKENNIDVISID